MAEFTCIGTGNIIDVNWYINGEPVDEGAGFYQSKIVLNPCQLKSTIIAIALLENNNTNLSCIVLSFSLYLISEPALFRIQGNY